MLSKKTKIKMCFSSVERAHQKYMSLVISSYGVKKVKEERNYALAQLNQAVFLLSEEIKNWR